jgi:hypothetical protein
MANGPVDTRAVRDRPEAWRGITSRCSGVQDLGSRARPREARGVDAEGGGRHAA